MKHVQKGEDRGSPFLNLIFSDKRTVNSERSKGLNYLINYEGRSEYVEGSHGKGLNPNNHHKQVLLQFSLPSEILLRSGLC